MPLCKWDVSAAIHIHVILADINREDERFLLDARLHPPVLLTCEREGYFSTSVVEGGQDVWPHHSAMLSGDLSILSGRFRKPFKFVFAVHTDLQDEDKCPLSMHTFISLKLVRVQSFLRAVFPISVLLLVCSSISGVFKLSSKVNYHRRCSSQLQKIFLSIAHNNMKYTLFWIYFKQI